MDNPTLSHCSYVVKEIKVGYLIDCFVVYVCSSGCYLLGKDL